ncbi:MAG: methionine synthase, partial [Cutibacterium avidum]|nr:methionine synthase [Cutibacterium avidum]
MRGSVAAMAEIFDELIPLPELPARGVGGQMVGRATALLIDLPVDHGPGGWRLADATDHAARSARSLLRNDLDDLEEVLANEEATVKISVAGPLTLATGLHMRAGESILADSSALNDVTASLAEGISQLLTELRRRMPRVTWTMQIDEPAAPAVLAGSIPTQSGLYRHPAMEATTATRLWQTIVSGC